MKVRYDSGNWQHGLPSSYRNYGCYCGPCLESNAAAKRSHRAKNAERLRADPTLAPHGTVSTYTNWGCRCTECRAAQAAAKRADRSNT